jgi:demethylmenaquinone methyltransferase/2-methoxy-6-polyprenyl-1,4-benzoquinol methylase
VIRPGGRLVILEFSKPSAFPFRQLYFFYFRRILPFLGRVISGDRAAYTYLPETVMQFPEGDDFLTILRELDIQRPKEKRLTFGIATVYTGEK